MNDYPGIIQAGRIDRVFEEHAGDPQIRLSATGWKIEVVLFWEGRYKSSPINESTYFFPAECFSMTYLWGIRSFTELFFVGIGRNMIAKL